MTREEAIKIVRNIYQTDAEKKALEALIPELAESDGEMIRNWLIFVFDSRNEKFVEELDNYCGNVTREQILAYLENLKDQPAEEDSSEKGLAECYLSKFDEKFPILPTLKGKQLADYKNFLNTCQQVFGLKEWGIHPTQAKLFAKLTLLWASWGAEHLQGIGAIDGDNEMDEEITLAYKIVPKFNIGDTILNTKTGDMCTIADRCLLYQYYSDINHCHEIKFDEQDDWELVEQKEQKSAEWSEEDKTIIDCAVEVVEKAGLPSLAASLKSLCPQQKKEWSEDDERNKNRAIFYTNYYQRTNGVTDGSKECINWLKSLRPSWKPSDEQKYDGNMDKECIKLCDILNSIPSIDTFESCCGHLKDRYSIWFLCNDIITVSRLGKCVERNYSNGKWELLVDSTDTHPTGVFWLRSKVPFQSYDEMEKSVNDLCNNIQHWFNAKFDSYFNCD